MPAKISRLASFASHACPTAVMNLKLYKASNAGYADCSMNVRTASNFGATAFAARSTQGSSYVRSMPIQIGLMNAD
jgi:hypothetical protein